MPGDATYLATIQMLELCRFFGNAARGSVASRRPHGWVSMVCGFSGSKKEKRIHEEMPLC